METASPDLNECTQFAEGVKSKTPEVMLAYNLSPSFNWDASGMTDQQMMEFIPQIARLGYCWQFITLAGFHADALVVDTFAKDYARRGMLAYVERIQREERSNGVDTLAHQKWSGANYYDRYLKTVQGGISSTAAMGKGMLRFLLFAHIHNTNQIRVCYGKCLFMAYAEFAWEIHIPKISLDSVI